MNRFFKIGFLLGLAGLLVMPADLVVARAFLGSAGPIWSACRDAIYDFARPAETFGHGLGAAIILAAIFAADPSKRKRLLCFVAIIYGSGLAADVVKLNVARERPSVYFDIVRHDFPSDVSHSFHTSHVLSNLDPHLQSFPSGHTAVAVGLAICLSLCWPRATWFFFSLAALTALQRIASGHHYLSDCLVGAGISCGVAASFSAIRLCRATLDHGRHNAALRHETSAA